MTQPGLVLLGLTKEEFFAEITSTINDRFDELKMDLMKSKVPDPEDYLTPKDVDKLLGISHTTRIAWSKKGILKRHYLNSKPYYLRSEIDASMIEEEKRR